MIISITRYFPPNFIQIDTGMDKIETEEQTGLNCQPSLDQADYNNISKISFKATFIF